MRRIFWLTLLLALAATAAQADFINGGFEDGTFSGWTATTTRNGVNFTPIKSAVVSTGYDYYSNYQLPMVAYGNYAGRVNNADNNLHISTLSQTAVWTDDHIYFAWAAVLEEPGNNVVHTNAQAPNFSIKLRDNTTGTDLYSVSFSVYNPPPGISWKPGRKGGLSGGSTVDTNSTWYFNDWVIVDLDTSAVKGHSLTLSVSAADCSLGGHGGYAYVDWFSSVQPPPPPPPVPIPGAVLLLSSALLRLGAYVRRQSVDRQAE